MHSQTLNPFYYSVANNVSYDTILKNLQEFQSLGVKQTGTTALNNTRNWIVNKYSQYSYTNILSDIYTSGSNQLYNVVLTKTGILYPNKYVIVCGHYDTRTGTGTNDNGSGIAIILEIARLIKNINTEYSVRFINFSGEEDGFLGSEHYVSDIVSPENMDIRLVFNIDEVGGVAGQTNNKIKCESDQSSPSSNNASSAAFTDTLANLTILYSSLTTEITNAYGSDYMPFQSNGEIITGYFEYNESSYVHTSNDNLSHLDPSYVSEIAKAATAATLYFAMAYEGNVSIAENETMKTTVFPNPFSDNIFVKNSDNEKSFFTIYNLFGEKIFEKDFSGNENICLDEIPAASYFYRIIKPSGKIIKSGILVKEK